MIERMFGKVVRARGVVHNRVRGSKSVGGPP